MAGELQLALLGNLEIRRDSVPLAGLRSGKARALLCYLAVTGRPHLRPSLVGLLWGDLPEALARNNLSKALTQLRQAVGPHLDIARREVAFNHERPYWLDVEAFTEGVSAQPASTKLRSARPDIERLADAAELYRGDFLEGFYVRQAPAFEEWVLAQRASLRELALQALHTLVVHAAGRGQAGRAAAINYSTRLLALEPWREEAHRQLMTLLAQSGQRGAALAQYEACRQVLAQELGVAPGAETTALHERIRDGDFAPVALPSFLSAMPTSDRPPTTFVAREHELAQLDGYLETALAGEGHVVFVSGEAGSGKTALVRAFAQGAQAKHADLVAVEGNCNAFTGVGDPYLPFREILAQLTGDVESRWATGALSTEGARRLWRLMPLAVQSLLERGPGLIDTLLAGPPLVARAAMAAPDATRWRHQLEMCVATDKADRGRTGLGQTDLYAQVTDLLSALAQQHPLILTVDDLQWVDAGSIDLLFHLGRRIAGSRILIVGIYRPTDVALGRDGKRHPLAPLIHEFQRQFGPIEVDLSQAGDEQFVEALLDSEPNRLEAAFRQAFYGQTRGHALYTVEMLRGMQERGDLVKDQAGRWIEGPTVDWASLPARVAGVIGERIGRLPAALQETLKVACIEGETFTAQVVAQVRGEAESEIVGQLSGKLSRQHRLVVSEGSHRIVPGGRRASRYRFRHILFQEYVYGRLDKVERAYLHEAVGNALEQVYAGQTASIAVQLARHFYAATRMDKAVDYDLQAGDRARGLHAHAEARQHYGRALDALNGLPHTEENRRRRVDTLIAHTICSWRADSPAHNLARLTEAEQLVQRLPSLDGAPVIHRQRLARIHFWLGRAHYVRGAYRACARYFQQALSAAQELGDAELIALSSSAIGQNLLSQGHFGEGEAALAQAIPLLDQTGNWSEWLRALNFHGGSRTTMGDIAGGLAEIEYARAKAQEKNAPTAIVHNLLALAYIHIETGDPLRSIEFARQALEAAERSGDRLYIYIACLWQSLAESRAGRLDAAAACAAKAQAAMQVLGEPLLRANYLAAIRAEIAYGAGRVQEALVLAERAVNSAQEMGGIFSEGLARRTWGKALAALDPPRWDEAEAQLAHSLRLLEAGQARLEAARTHVAWGAVCRERGDLTAAREHWEQAAAQWETSGLTHELERTRALVDHLPPTAS